MKDFIRQCSAKDGMFWHSISHIILEEITRDITNINSQTYKLLKSRITIEYFDSNLSKQSGWHTESRFGKVAVVSVLKYSVSTYYKKMKAPIRKRIAKVAALLIITISSLSVNAQKDSMDLKPVFGVSVRSGMLTYYGDLNNQKLPFTTDNKLNYGAGLNVKWKYLSASLNYEQIKFGQTLNTPTEHKNFMGKGSMYGLEVNFWPVIKKNYGFYVGTGISYLNYSLFTDTLDKNGNKYNYWSDGTIRDQPENYNNIFTSNKTRRDYNFESSLGSSSAVIFPVKAGIMFRFIKDVQMSYNASFYFTNKNDIDGKLNSLKKDYLMYNTVSLTWYFNSYDKVDQGIYKDINFKDLWNTDEDGDGVSDANDKCFGTAKGIKVDGKGCPYDSDKDGVDDHKDKEKNTDKKKLTDLDGVGQEPGVPELNKDLPEEETTTPPELEPK